MCLRKSVNGRPSGTDGSDFSYRMVVDSRYQKVADGKYLLSVLIFAQAFAQLFVVVALFLTTPKRSTLDRVSVSSPILCLFSLLIGELGRRRSRVNLLKFYLFGSSVAALISVAPLLTNGKTFEIIKDLSRWDLIRLEASILELFRITSVLLGVSLQMLAFGVLIPLIHYMAPPKRA